MPFETGNAQIDEVLRDVTAYGPLERVQRVAHLDDLGGTTRAEPEDAHGRHATE
jgi:hypothetical protein